MKRRLSPTGPSWSAYGQALPPGKKFWPVL